MYCFNVVGGLNLRSEIVNKRRTRGPLSLSRFLTHSHTRENIQNVHKQKKRPDDDEDEKDGGDDTRW